MKTIVYVSNEWFVDTDITVLAELSRVYTVHWLYYANFKSPRFDIGELKQYCKDNNIVLHLYECHSKQLSWSLFRLQWQFIKEIRKIKPDLVIRISFHIYWVLLSFLLRKYKTVYAFHDVISHSNTKGGFIDDWCRNRIVRKNRNFILYSSSQYNYFVSKWHDKNVKNVGMSIKSFGISSKQPPLLSDGIKLLFFGRIERYKGLDLLINALESVAAKGISNIQLSVYGKGQFWDQCENIIKNRNLYNLNIRFIENSELADIFSTHHFLALPYRDATQSGPLLIAANYGLPILAPKLEGFMQLYPTNAGVYYEGVEIEEALCKISRMTENEYAEIRSNVSKLKESLSPETIAANYIDLFNSII